MKSLPAFDSYGRTVMHIEQAIRQQLEFKLSEQSDSAIREKIVSTMVRRVQRTLQAMAFESLKTDSQLPAVSPEPQGAEPVEFLQEAARQWITQLQTSILSQIIDRE